MQNKGYAAVMELADGSRFINLRTVSGTKEGVEEAVKEAMEGMIALQFVGIVPVVVTALAGISETSRATV